MDSVRIRQSAGTPLADGDLILSDGFEEESSGWISLVNFLLLTTALLTGFGLQSAISDPNLYELRDTEPDHSGHLSSTEMADPRLQKHSLGDEVEVRTRLRKQLQDAVNERDMLRQQQREAVAAQDTEGHLASKKAEIDVLKDMNRELENKLLDLQQTTRLAFSMMSERHETILRPLSKAPVVVRIRSRLKKADLNLDLYVQDPLDRLCHWKVPRIESRQAEVATLIPSELLVMGETDDDSNVTQFLSEEVYCSTELLAGPASRPYLVFCMLRETGERYTGEQISQPVDWEVVIQQKDQAPMRLTGQTTVKQSGRVMVRSTGDFYVGLVPLVGFHLQSAVQPEAIQLPTEDLPQVFRGWRKGKSNEEAVPLGKSPEMKQIPGN